MDIQALNQAVLTLVEKREKLNQIDYSNNEYDELEEELHTLEDDFQETYGDYLEDAFHEVHDEFCPDTDVLLPIAYLPKRPLKTEEGFSVDFKDGVYVEVDDYASDETKLVLLPSPTRIVLQVDKDTQEVVWRAK